MREERCVIDVSVNEAENKDLRDHEVAACLAVTSPTPTTGRGNAPAITTACLIQDINKKITPSQSLKSQIKVKNRYIFFHLSTDRIPVTLLRQNICILINSIIVLLYKM